jgi:hypothetical protein
MASSGTLPLAPGTPENRESAGKQPSAKNNDYDPTHGLLLVFADI